MKVFSLGQRLNEQRTLGIIESWEAVDYRGEGGRVGVLPYLR